jgi:hypothetical protein
MITLRQIAAEIIRIESGGDQSIDSQLSEGYVVLMIRQALNKMMPGKVFERLSNDDRSALQLITVPYEVTVVGSSPNQYIDLPEFYENLPNNKGFVSVAPIDDPSNHFIPRSQPGVTRNLPCADLDPGTNSYWSRGFRVFFDNDIDLGKVLVELVVAAPDSIGINSSLPIYPEMQYDLIMMVRQMLANQPVQDKVLDGNKDIGVKTAR